MLIKIFKFRTTTFQVKKYVISFKSRQLCRCGGIVCNEWGSTSAVLRKNTKQIQRVYVICIKEWKRNSFIEKSISSVDIQGVNGMHLF